MTRFWHMLTRHVTSDVWDIRVAQYACFAVGPALLLTALYALGRHPATHGEMIASLLGAVNACLLSIVVGLLLPLSERVRSGDRPSDSK